MDDGITIRFSLVSNCYEKLIRDKTKETYEGWQNKIYVMDGIFKNEENDWEMIYLCRQGALFSFKFVLLISLI